MFNTTINKDMRELKELTREDIGFDDNKDEKVFSQNSIDFVNLLLSHIMSRDIPLPISVCSFSCFPFPNERVGLQWRIPQTSIVVLSVDITEHICRIFTGCGFYEKHIEGNNVAGIINFLLDTFPNLKTECFIPVDPFSESISHEPRCILCSVEDGHGEEGIYCDACRILCCECEECGEYSDFIGIGCPTDDIDKYLGLRDSSDQEKKIIAEGILAHFSLDNRETLSLKSPSPVLHNWSLKSAIDKQKYVRIGRYLSDLCCYIWYCNTCNKNFSTHPD
jgi:hypothetical protein